jgi:hypothetical protein
MLPCVRGSRARVGGWAGGRRVGLGWVLCVPTCRAPFTKPTAVIACLARPFWRSLISEHQAGRAVRVGFEAHAAAHTPK